MAGGIGKDKEDIDLYRKIDAYIRNFGKLFVSLWCKLYYIL